MGLTGCAKNAAEPRAPIAREDERPQHGEQNVNAYRGEHGLYVDHSSPKDRPRDRERREDDERRVEHRSRARARFAERDERERTEKRDQCDSAATRRSRGETSAANNDARSVAPVNATLIGRAHFDVLPAIKNTKVASNRTRTRPKRYSIRVRCTPPRSSRKSGTRSSCPNQRGVASSSALPISDSYLTAPSATIARIGTEREAHLHGGDAMVGTSGGVWAGLGIIGLIIWIALAFWPARVARRKGHSFIGYFILSLFFFPLALILAYLVKDRRGLYVRA